MEKYENNEHRGYTISIYYDTDPLNPRVEFDGNLATFVCNHKHYALGDRTGVEQVLEELINKHCSLFMVEQYMTKYHNLTITPNEEYDEKENNRVPIYTVKYSVSDGQAFHEPEIYEYDIFDDMDDWLVIQSYIEELDYSERIDLLEATGKIRTTPISIYDHSGVKVYLGTPCDRWDSSVVGFAYIEKDKIMKEKGGVTEENWKDEAEYCMEQEMKEYSAYVEGDVYTYRIIDPEGNETDEYSGDYYGDEQLGNLLSDAKDDINSLIEFREKNVKQNNK